MFIRSLVTPLVDPARDISVADGGPVVQYAHYLLDSEGNQILDADGDPILDSEAP